MGKVFLTILMLYPWMGEHGTYTDRHIGPYESEEACERAVTGLVIQPRPGERQPLVAVYCGDGSGSERAAHLRTLRARERETRDSARRPVVRNDATLYPGRKGEAPR